MLSGHAKAWVYRSMTNENERMLDTTTKRRIDECRDILVGKLPDPKSQIEQITIALIYKFMDDMDKEAVELGGEARFFTGEAARYAWDALFDPQLGSAELVKLYDEALESMELNPHIPQLFRDIFKNAYLPYRDPETLRMFLKTIGQFQYSHSEKLGDAFEYLLQVMGSQGDAGQFRPPRHIIDFTVQAVNPGKNDRVLDPACGTAGFLISAFKHILQQNDNKLTPDERKKLIANFTGYDISPDMVRLSLVNLYLHGFSDPHIHEYDTLTSEERWGHRFDVILANPPFMSPKGGIRPHKKFSVSSTRSEVLFVDYIAEHLSPQGRAGVIVPEGVVFQSGKAYKELRKMLVEHYLWAVVSLPSGVFNPYSGVKTSLLLMDRALAKKSKRILFVKVENDGFDLGAQRRELKGSQLPVALEFLQKYRHATLEGTDFEEGVLTHAVDKSRIAESGDYNLSGERYRISEDLASNFPLVELQSIFDIKRGGSPRPIKEFLTEKENGINWIKIGDTEEGKKYITQTKEKIRPEGLKKSRLVKPGDFILSNSMSFGRPYVVQIEGCIHDGWLVFKQKEQNLSKDYIYSILSSDEVKAQFEKSATGGVVRNLNIDLVKKVLIPLPPLEVQREIVEEIEGYQRIIDGARMVVDNYRPQIRIQPDWEMVELGEVCEVKSGGTPDRKNESYWNGQIPYVKTGQINFNTITQAEEFITEKGLKNSSARLIPANTVLMAMYGQGITRGRVGILTIKAAINQAVAALLIKNHERLNIDFLFYQLIGKYDYLRKISDARGGNQSNLNAKLIRELKIVAPSLITQEQIVEAVKREQQIIESNKKLITIFEQKIKDRIAEVWGSGEEVKEAEPEREAVETM